MTNRVEELLPCGHCGTEMRRHKHCFSHPRPRSGDCVLRYYSFDNDKAEMWNRRTAISPDGVEENVQPSRIDPRYEAPETLTSAHSDACMEEPTTDPNCPRCNDLRAFRTAISPDGVEERGWQPIETAPVNEIVFWWIAGDGGDGWLKLGMRQVSGDPLCIVEEDGSLYWPHENGGWATHWQPLPEPPAISAEGDE